MKAKKTIIGIIAVMLLHIFLCITPTLGSTQLEVIFNNFGPNDDYHPNYYTAVGYFTDPVHLDRVDTDTAMAFTPSFYNYILEKVELGVTLRSGLNKLDVWVMEDNDNMPGAIIETISLNDVLPSYPGVYAPVTAVSHLNPLLSAGVQYWIGLSAPAPDDIDIAWHSNTFSYGSRGVQRQRINGSGDWIYYGLEQSTFRVIGTRNVRTIHVDDDGPNDPAPGNPNTSDPLEDGSVLHPFDSIQEAVTDASNGDTVLIADGTYSGNGNYNINLQSKAITVRSQNGPDKCIIDCKMFGRGFSVVDYTGPEAVIEGITILYGWDDDNGGGGIYCSMASPTITNCVISDCQAPMGGGINCSSGSDPLISQCVITQNDAIDGYGGGIYCDSTSDPTVTNCIIKDNTATHSGGGLAADDSSPTIRNSVFIGNEASNYDGGGICFIGLLTYPTVTNCTLVYNSAASSGGGIYCDYDISAEITNCIIYYNSAAYSPQIENGSFTFPSFSCIQNWDSGSGNINTDPSLKDDDYHLNWDSPCRDAGNPAGSYPGQEDIDTQPRVMHNIVDMGADELPPPVQNISTGVTYDTIQQAINNAVNDHTIVVNEGVHYPPNYYGIDFLGKEITLRSSDPTDPEVVMATVIDCSGQGRGFYFHGNEGPGSILDGFTIENGYTAEFPGGGISCEGTNPTIRNCVIRNCQAWQGGGIYYYSSVNPTLYNCLIENNAALYGNGGGILCENSSLMLDNSRIINNDLDGIRLDLTSTLNILGTVEIVSNNLVGQGEVLFTSGADLKLTNAEVFLKISGPGTMQVEAGAEAVIDGDAVIDLGDPENPGVRGIINGLGLLKVEDNAAITNADINLTRAVFDGNAYISDSEIHVNNKAPYGAMFVGPNTSFHNTDIFTDGDRYMNMKPAMFQGDLVNCRIYVTITEGADDTRGGLFECRGEPGLTTIDSCDPNNTFFCAAVPGTIPDCNTRTWTLERLELTPDAKINLTNRFPFQPPYDPGTDYDVVYVKELILREGAILNTSYNNIYYETLTLESGASIKNEPLLGFSMINIAFDDQIEFLARVTHNNYTDPNDPALDRHHVRRLEGLSFDPNGVMIMQNLTGGIMAPETVHARAKGLFSKSCEEKVLIRFEYLFETADPNSELVVYLSDTPELGDHNDPNSYHEVARILPPPTGQPGSVGSGRLGVFEDYVSTGGLDFVMGTRMELLLLGSSGTSVYINNWDPQVLCDGICLDLNWNDTADEEDFLLVVGNCGTSTELDSEGDTYACLEGPFGNDGTVDSSDICAWDWVLNDSERLNLCGSLPLTGGTASSAAGTSAMAHTGIPSLPMSLPSGGFDDLLISGKKGTTGAAAKLQDGIYVFDETGQFSEALIPESERGNIRIVDDFEGNIYIVNSETGVSTSDPNDVIVAPAVFSSVIEPRYNSSAFVYVGPQDTGDDTYGRPILDAAFDVDFAENDYIYVVPVVVDPNGADPYLASAKLHLTGGGAYTIVHIYDDPDADNPADNRELNALKEIETDSSGSVYVINTHSLNESDTIWRYNSSTGAMTERLTLGNPALSNYIPAPSGLHASRFEDMIYLGSSLNSPDANSISVYGFSTSGSMTLTRTVDVNEMGHISDITDNPASGTLWVVGFSMENPPEYPNPYALPFYDPYIAAVPIGAAEVLAEKTLTADPDNDLALPLSIIWTGPIPEKCGGADLDGNGTVNFEDFAKFAEYWPDSDCASSDNCQGADLEPESAPDGDVDIYDLEVMCNNWLQIDC